MDREFIIKNQIVERYLAGRLPPKGVTDFEKLIRSRPQLIDELGLADKVNAGLRLLDAAGVAEPWQEKPKKLWEKPGFGLGAAGAAVAALIACLVLSMQISTLNADIARQQQQIKERPIAPSTAKRNVTIIPTRNGPPANSMFTITHGDFADMKVDLGWSRYGAYRLSMQRENQGRVGMFDGMEKDSNGQLRLSLNAAAFGPGEYVVAIDGLTMSRQAIPVAWFRFRVQTKD